MVDVMFYNEGGWIFERKMPAVPRVAEFVVTETGSSCKVAKVVWQELEHGWRANVHVIAAEVMEYGEGPGPESEPTGCTSNVS